MLKKTMTFAVALTMSVAIGSTASAGTISVSKQGTNIFGPDNEFRRVSYQLETGPGTFATRTNVRAGAFHLKADDGSTIQDMLAFCLQPFEWLDLNKHYEMGTSLSQSIVDNLNTLGANAFGLISDSESSAAFQLAVWEITQEAGTVLDLTAGDFQMTTSGLSQTNVPLAEDARDLANTWLANIGSTWTTPDRGFVIMSADGTQDLLTNLPSPVPLPASGMMLIAALGAGGLVARKRRKAA